MSFWILDSLEFNECNPCWGRVVLDGLDWMRTGGVRAEEAAELVPCRGVFLWRRRDQGPKRNLRFHMLWGLLLQYSPKGAFDWVPSKGENPCPLWVEWPSSLLLEFLCAGMNLRRCLPTATLNWSKICKNIGIFPWVGDHAPPMQSGRVIKQPWTFLRTTVESNPKLRNHV